MSMVNFALGAVIVTAGSTVITAVVKNIVLIVKGNSAVLMANDAFVAMIAEGWTVVSIAVISAGVFNAPGIGSASMVVFAINASLAVAGPYVHIVEDEQIVKNAPAVIYAYTKDKETIAPYVIPKSPVKTVATSPSPPNPAGSPTVSAVTASSTPTTPSPAASASKSTTWWTRSRPTSRIPSPSAATRR